MDRLFVAFLAAAFLVVVTLGWDRHPKLGVTVPVGPLHLVGFHPIYLGLPDSLAAARDKERAGRLLAEGALGTCQTNEAGLRGLLGRQSAAVARVAQASAGRLASNERALAAGRLRLSAATSAGEVVFSTAEAPVPAYVLIAEQGEQCRQMFATDAAFVGQLR